jgi:hypothetical protein
VGVEKQGELLVYPQSAILDPIHCWGAKYLGKLYPSSWCLSFALQRSGVQFSVSLC